jgi:hypothetical protein
MQLGTTVSTDEYTLHGRLKAWGYQHRTVNHTQEEYARDSVGDGFLEVPVTTREGFWSLLCSGLRPHRAISQQP